MYVYTCKFHSFVLNCMKAFNKIFSTSYDIYIETYVHMCVCM